MTKTNSPKYVGNAGEWGELYALLKLLAEGEFHSADRDMEIIPEENFPVIAAFRKSQTNKETISFTIDKANQKIKVALQGEELCFDRDIFKENALVILNETKNKNREIPSLSDFWRDTFYPRLKEESASKSDLRVKIYDPRVKAEKELGFSVKSKIGGDPTLFNSSGNRTNIKYKLRGYQALSSEDKKRACNLSNKSLVRLLLEKECSLDFESVCDEGFKNNLLMIDSCFDKVLGHAVLHSYQMKGGNIKTIIDYLNITNPCEFPRSEHLFYEYKMKQFLLAAALGMTSSSIWQGIIDATGGFIVVRSDGELLCYHIYNWNELQDYLLENTYFDQPSTGRHKYGKIDPKNLNELLLNFQIKFK